MCRQPLDGHSRAVGKPCLFAAIPPYGIPWNGAVPSFLSGVPGVDRPLLTLTYQPRDVLFSASVSTPRVLTRPVLDGTALLEATSDWNC